jgi:hypothetical protein
MKAIAVFFFHSFLFKYGLSMVQLWLKDGSIWLKYGSSTMVLACNGIKLRVCFIGTFWFGSFLKVRDTFC